MPRRRTPPTSPSPAATPVKTSPRVRPPNLDTAEKLVAAQWHNPTEEGLREARRSLVRRLWRNRKLKDPEAPKRAERLRALYDRVMRMHLAREWEISDAERLSRQRNRGNPSQLGREAQQRTDPTRSARRAEVEAELAQRNTERFSSNALATALWALHQGDRDWTPIPTGGASSTTPPSGTPRPIGAAYLEVHVPETAFGPAHRLRLYRHDYEQLLDLWGYHSVTRATRLAAKLRGTGSLDRDVQDLYDLALSSAKHPNLARAWHGYLTGTRLGDVFAEHSSGTMQLAPRRSGDLREALLEIYRQCQVLPRHTPFTEH